MDQTLNLAFHPYTFISRMRTQSSRDVFETRINFQKTICMTGEEAARIFYDKDLFTRVDAAPFNLRTTLFGKGAIQTLDDASHVIRKRMFMSLLTPDSVRLLVTITRTIWQQQLILWKKADQIVLSEEMSKILCMAVCVWAAVPLDDVRGRTRECNALIEGGGGGLIRYLKGFVARISAEAWISDHIEKLRKGPLPEDLSQISQGVAFQKDYFGRILPARVAAVELINIIRPTVAVARFIVYAALALEQFPEMRPTTSAEKKAFILEVKRYYPFFPIVAARVRRSFSWRGFEFKEGRRTFFDLYGTNHDRRSWQDPLRFNPCRFLDKEINPYAYVPQGGSDAASNRRCPGESIASSLMLMSLDMLLNEIQYEVPKQDLRVTMATAPAGPKSGFIITRVSSKY